VTGAGAPSGDRDEAATVGDGTPESEVPLIPVEPFGFRDIALPAVLVLGGGRCEGRLAVRVPQLLLVLVRAPAG
jgi:hypothetical protein